MGHRQHYDSSAAFRFEAPGRFCRNHCRTSNSGGTADAKVRWPAGRNRASFGGPKEEYRMAGLVRLSKILALAMGALCLALPASAQAPQPPAAKPEMRENCPGMVASNPRPWLGAAM